MEIKVKKTFHLTHKETGKKFWPHQHGFLFGNHFERRKYYLVFDHAEGMCGGMVFTVADYFLWGLSIPSYKTTPTLKTDQAFLSYITKRQINSVMQRSTVNYFLPLRFGQSACKKMYNKIKQHLSNHHLSILGLIRTRNVLNLSQNHQVGVYAYTEKHHGEVILHIYDPVYPSRDDISISFNVQKFSGFTCHPSALGPIYSIFHPKYVAKIPKSF